MGENKNEKLHLYESPEEYQNYENNLQLTLQESPFVPDIDPNQIRNKKMPKKIKILIGPAIIPLLILLTGLLLCLIIVVISEIREFNLIKYLIPTIILLVFIVIVYTLQRRKRK